MNVMMRDNRVVFGPNFRVALDRFCCCYNVGITLNVSRTIHYSDPFLWINWQFPACVPRYLDEGVTETDVTVSKTATLSCTMPGFVILPGGPSMFGPPLDGAICECYPDTPGAICACDSMESYLQFVISFFHSGGNWYMGPQFTGAFKTFYECGSFDGNVELTDENLGVDPRGTWNFSYSDTNTRPGANSYQIQLVVTDV